MDVSAYDANGNRLALRRFLLSVDVRSVIDLSQDLGFSGIYRLTIVTSGGKQVSCKTGNQVVLDNMELFIH